MNGIKLVAIDLCLCQMFQLSCLVSSMLQYLFVVLWIFNWEAERNEDNLIRSSVPEGILHSLIVRGTVRLTSFTNISFFPLSWEFCWISNILHGNALNSRLPAAEFELGLCQDYFVLNMLLLRGKKKSLWYVKKRGRAGVCNFSITDSLLLID